MDAWDEELRECELAEGPDALALDSPIIIIRAKRGEAEDVHRLLDKGANPNSIGSDEETLLQVAIENGMEDVAERLLLLGVDSNEIRATHTPTPLYLAARLGNENLVRLLLKHGAFVDAPSYANETPLMGACESGHVQVAKLLIDAGAGIEKSSPSGWTPLIHAGRGGHVSIARILIENGANPYTRDSFGHNATDWARLKFDGMVAQGFRELGIPDDYVLDDSFKAVAGPSLEYDIFISYRQRHYANDADEIMRILTKRGKRVFVDRHELKLVGNTTVDKELLKWRIKYALKNSSLTLFFEIDWKDPAYSSEQFDWQFFELLNSKKVVCISPERGIFQPLEMIPGEKLRSGSSVSYSGYTACCERILEIYFS